jgi:Flp pilus assembly protein TadD
VRAIQATISGVMAALFMAALFSGCAAPQLNLQPSIRSAAPRNASNHYERMQAAARADALTRELPAMSAGEHEMLGDAALGRGDLQIAYSHYDKALQAEPGLPRLVSKQGLALLFAGQLETARELFESVLAVDPSFAPAQEGLGRVFLADNDAPNAKIHFEKAVALDAGLWQSQNCLGTLYDREGRWEQAEAAYRAALAASPREATVLNNLGLSFLLAGRYQKAVEYFRLAIQNGFSGKKVYNNLALALARLGHYEDAFQAFKTAGGEARAYNNLGCIYLQIGWRAKAAECFEKAIALDPIFYVTANENLKRAGGAQGL